MSKRRNAHAVAARARKAGAHSGSRRPDVYDAINGYEEEQLEELKDRKRNTDLCPVCEASPLTGCGVWNPILGELCSLNCLEAYWSKS